MSEEFSLLKLVRERKSLYIYDSPDGRILFSLLPMSEYNLVKKVGQNFPGLIPELEDDIWRRCVVEQSFGTDLSAMKAGVISTLAELVMRLSCPQDIMSVELDLIAEREQLQDVTKQLNLKVCEAFPSYTPDEVDELPWSELIKKVAQAEKVLGKEVEFQTQEFEQTIEGTESVPMVERNGIEVIDFEALNREIQEG